MDMQTKQATPGPVAYRPKDARVRLGVGHTTLYKWIKEGRIKPIKIGGVTLIPETEIQRVLGGEAAA
jgi:excisionase family DNA binding protein